VKFNKNWIWVGAAVLAGLGITYFTGGNDLPKIKVTVPTLTAAGQDGLVLFTAKCSACHGKDAGGTGNGPPLINKIYRTNHHGDVAFQRAARFGVRSHHWRFGNMPPVRGIKQEQVTKIVTFIREVQRANGIN